MLPPHTSLLSPLMKEKFLHCNADWQPLRPLPASLLQRSCSLVLKLQPFQVMKKERQGKWWENALRRGKYKYKRPFSLISTIPQNFFVYCANLLIWLGGNVIKIKRIPSEMLCPTYTVYTAYTVYTVYTFKLLYTGQAWSAYNSTWLCDLCMGMDGWSGGVPLRLLWLLEHLRC